jgi:hypothetical protein
VILHGPLHGPLHGHRVASFSNFSAT